MEKIWFVTGAGHGFGLALVKQLIKQGYKVAAVAENIRPIRKSLGTLRPNLLMLEIEIADEDSISRAAYDAAEYFGRLDVIINADKEGLAGNIDDLSDEQIRRNFEINIFSGLNVIRAVLPYLKEQCAGHTFHLSSSGRKNGAGLGIYRATEMGMIAILESLAAELQPFGIDVSVLTPGNTPADLGIRTILADSTQRRIEDHDPVIKQIQWCMHQAGEIVHRNMDPVTFSSPELPNRLFAV